jgi:hypothetical protein
MATFPVFFNHPPVDLGHPDMYQPKNWPFLLNAIRFLTHPG